MPVAKPSTTLLPSAGLLHQANNILRKRCRVFIGTGTLDTGVPTSKATLATFYSTNILPFGDMDKTGSRLTWTQDILEIDFSKIPGSFQLAGGLKSVTVTKDMIKFVNNAGTSVFSLFFLPDGESSTAPETLFCVSGVTLTIDGEIAVVDDGLSIVNINISKTTENLETAIRIEKFTS